MNDLDRNIKLVSLKQDVDIQEQFIDLLTLNPDDEELNKILSELEFATPKNSEENNSKRKNQNMRLFYLKKVLRSG